MSLTMKEKSRYQAGPFPLLESRTERKVSHPGRIHQYYRVQKPEVRPAPSQQAGTDARTLLHERRRNWQAPRERHQPDGDKTREFRIYCWMGGICEERGGYGTVNKLRILVRRFHRLS
jgi:hypothetical protein